MNSLKRIHYLQHVGYEDLGCIRDWIHEKNYSLSQTALYKKAAFPPLEEIDWLIILGGPMGAYEEDKYTWLRPEKQFIEDFIKTGKPVLGICLGSQLLADVLGGKVYPNTEKEIGWYPVIGTLQALNTPLKNIFQEHFTAFHWHGDTFDLPDQCTNLAFSEACTQQAFLYGSSVLGLQFHLEIDVPQLDLMLDHGRGELVPATFIQAEYRIRNEAKLLPRCNARMYGLLEWMDGLPIPQAAEE